MNDLFDRLEDVTKRDVAMPSAKLADLLNGKIAWLDAEPSIRSWAAFYILDAARTIIGMAGQDQRRKALGTLPATIRPVIETEIQRLWPIRNTL